jgi:hypothetical protein
LRNKSKDRTKKGLLIGIIFVLFFIGLFFLNVNYNKQMFVDASKKNLQVLADVKALQVNEFLGFQENRLSVLSSLSVFRDVVNDPYNAEKIKLAKDMINEIKDKIPGIGVLTKEGIIIVAENNPAGTDYSMLPGFPADDSMGIIFTRYYDQQRKKDYYDIGGPIYDSVNKSKVIGVIAYDVELDKISSIMKDNLDTNTSEVYLIDGNKLLLSGSKYIGQDNKNGVLIQEVNSDGAETCLDDLKKYTKNGIVEEHEGNVSKYINYMGDEVYGAHAYAPAIGGCVMAEELVDGFSKYPMSGYIANIFKKEVK